MQYPGHILSQHHIEHVIKLIVLLLSILKASMWTCIRSLGSVVFCSTKFHFIVDVLSVFQLVTVGIYLWLALLDPFICCSSSQYSHVGQ